ncbi:MAG: hypothetical protein KGJ02_04745 [Verrucomicrobiota bacterium]|nr:hypothetical protein [Verrucomicrobiota bacterium]
MIWEEFRTPPKFGCELPGPKGPGFRRPDEMGVLFSAACSVLRAADCVCAIGTTVARLHVDCTGASALVQSRLADLSHRKSQCLSHIAACVCFIGQGESRRC